MRLHLNTGICLTAWLIMCQPVLAQVTNNGPGAGGLASRFGDEDANKAPPESGATEVKRLIRTGHRQDALKRADELLAKEPHNVEVRFLHAEILADLGQPANARREYELLTAEFPEVPEPYNNLAVLQAAAGQLSLAEQTLRRALVALPGYATAEENLGDIYVALAEASYASALQHDPARNTSQVKLKAVRELKAKLPG